MKEENNLPKAEVIVIRGNKDSNLYLIMKRSDINEFDLDALPDNVFYVKKEIYELVDKLTDVLYPNGQESREHLINYLCCTINACHHDVDVALDALGI